MTVKDVAKYALGEMKWMDVLSIFVLILLGTLIGLLVPYINEQIYDLFIPLGYTQGLYGVCAVIIACYLGNVAFSIVKGFTNFRCFNRMRYAFQSATFDRLFNLPASFFRESESAELAQKAFGATGIFSSLQNVVFLTGFSTLFSLFYLIRMNKYSKKLMKPAAIMLLQKK